MKEWMGHLRIEENECKNKKNGSLLKEQFISDKMMRAKIINELTTIPNTSDITSEQVLSWAKKIET